jgi:hypothetical protein
MPAEQGWLRIRRDFILEPDGREGIQKARTLVVLSFV